MDTRQNFRIAGTGTFLPPWRVTAEEMDARLHREIGWTRMHTGVDTRFECRHPENILTMGTEAIRTAMRDANVSWSDIDLLIDCSTSRCRPIPCNAAHFQQAFGREARGVPCFDLQSTCLGFIVAVHTANALFGTGGYRRILIVASEAPLTGVNWQQPESTGLMGDGAAAVVLECSPSSSSLVLKHETFAEHIDICKVEGGAHFLPAFEFIPERRGDFLFDMNGPALFRVAMSRLPRMVKTALAEWKTICSQRGASANDLHILPHQASPKALETVRSLIGSSESSFTSIVRDFGNMAAASLPFVLDHALRSQAISSGQPVMLLGTSAGYSQAALIITI